jgi:hypothetical protein
MHRPSPPQDLNILVQIPDEDIQSGEYRFAECWCYGGYCFEPVKYKMVIEEWPFDEGNYNTAFWCEKHKP